MKQRTRSGYCHDYCYILYYLKLLIRVRFEFLLVDLSVLASTYIYIHISEIAYSMLAKQRYARLRKKKFKLIKCELTLYFHISYTMSNIIHAQTPKRR